MDDDHNKEFGEMHSQAEKLYQDLVLTVSNRVRGIEFHPFAVVTASVNLLLSTAEVIMMNKDDVLNMVKEAYRELEEIRKNNDR